MEHTIELKIEKKSVDGDTFYASYLVFDGFAKIYFDRKYGNYQVLSEALQAGHSIVLKPCTYKIEK